MTEPFIVGIRFRKVNKVYHFDASDVRDLHVGDYVIVPTLRGRQMGEVIQTFDTAPERPPEGWKPVERKATPRDLVLRQLWQKKECEAAEICRRRVLDMHISDVKISSAEFSLDGSRLSFLYSSENEQKPHLEDLRNDMQKFYPGVKIELRAVGPRDLAKTLEGMGACGLETRCCAKFLTSFNPISVKMAKAQQISLTSMEITGMCGRLRCCMVYEYESYEDVRKSMPKRGKRVFTPRGEGKVVTLYPLKGTALVSLEDGSYREYSMPEITPWSEAEAKRREEVSILEREAREAERRRPAAPPQRPAQQAQPRNGGENGEGKPKKHRSGRGRRRKGRKGPGGGAEGGGAPPAA